MRYNALLYFDVEGDTVLLASEGDTYLQVQDGAESQDFRVSSQALSQASSYFAATFSPRWSEEGEFTADAPLVLHNDNLCAMAIFLALIHGVDVFGVKLTRPKFMDLAVVCDKYMFEGPFPAWIEEGLESFFLPTNDIIEDPTRVIGTSLLDLMCCARVFDFPRLFCKASRQMMWILPGVVFQAHLSDNQHAILPENVGPKFRSECQRLASYLVTKLPNLLYPDPHGTNQWWCENCATVSHEQRWLSEVVTQSGGWVSKGNFHLLLSIGEIVRGWIDKISQMDNTRHVDEDQQELPCGRFRLRWADISMQEIQLDLFMAMGGMCLACCKAGKVKYDVFCAEHKMCLVVN